DSRNQMLYGYYLWGDYDFAEASLDLLGENYFADTGYLALCAPSQDKITIPVYTFTWISAVYEFVLHSGRIGYIGKQLPRINAILDGALKRKAPGYDELYSPEKRKISGRGTPRTEQSGISMNGPETFPAAAFSRRRFTRSTCRRL
ncbi:MAG: hypothetical protein V8T87_02065, partial [Victivallales bacterium]